MKSRVVTCPACAGPVEFQVSSSLVTVCEFCQSVVARGDKTVEEHGKVADLVQTDSPLKRGLVGRFGRKRFELIGRVQYKHPAGGTWDEWYLAFPSGRCGWLAEAQGKYYLTFQKKLASGIELPEFDDLEVGQKFKLRGSKELTVAEKGVAEAIAAEGEIPWAFRPGVRTRFVDLHGADKTFATFDYAEDVPQVYVGKEVTIDELEISGDAWEGAPPPATATALQVNCPQCGGTLTLHVPDETNRVACQHCASLLDCNQGQLEYLTTLKSRHIQPVIPLGSVGTLRGTEYTVIGFMERYALYEGRTYPWTEYLLYNATLGFRWLVRNQRHWSLAESVSPSDANDGASHAHYYQGANGENSHRRSFSIYDRGKAYVRHVLGEFYWRVELGDEVRTADFIDPPQMLSFEWSKTADSEEVNVSLASYVGIEEIEEAFGLTDILRPFGVGPIQPRPNKSATLKLWPAFLMVLVLINVGVGILTKPQVDQWLFVFALGFVSLIPMGILLYNHNFEVQRWSESDYSPYATEE